MRKIAIAVGFFALILFASQIAFGATPAIDLVGYGVIVGYRTIYRSIEFPVKVIDHDGIDENSHIVKVFFPDGGPVLTLDWKYNLGSNAAFYWCEYPLGAPPSEGPSGEYVFQVTDPEGNVGTATDNLIFTPLDPPDQTSFTPGLWEEYIIGSFDNVEVDGELYDDFESGSIDTVNNWEEPNCPCAEIDECPSATIEDGQLKLSVRDTVGVGRCYLNFQDPENINRISADITLDSVSATANPYAHPHARISGSFFKNIVNDNDIHSYIQVYNNRVVCLAEEEPYVNGIFSWNVLFNETLFENEISLGPDDTVNVSISWDDEKDELNFSAIVDGNEEKTTYTPQFDPAPSNNPYRSLQSKINIFLDDNSPTFSWGPVDNAIRYRVRIYDSTKTGLIWEGYTGYQEISYRLPPGVLATNTMYHYRIDAFIEHLGFEVDNISKAPPFDTGNLEFYTAEIDPQDPYIEFDSTGVQTWKSPTGLGLVFWIKVHDAQGMDDIASVTVEFPDEHVEDLFLDHYTSPTSGIYARYVGALPEAGTYTFRVTDNDGHQYAVPEDLIVDSIDYPANGTMSPVPYTVLGTTEAEFDWEDIAGAAFYRVEIFSDTGQRIYNFVTTESQFSLPEGFLEESTDEVSKHYEWRVTTRREFSEENVDNTSATERFHIATTVFFTDTDDNGIADAVDTGNNEFSDGDTNGKIESPGEQTLTVADAPFPDKGVWITASGGSIPAIIDMCGGQSQLELSDGDEVIVTCGSVTANVTRGVVLLETVANDGTIATVELNAGNSLVIEQESFTFTVPETNSEPVVFNFTVPVDNPEAAIVYIDGVQFTIEPGESQKIVEIDIKPGDEPNCINDLKKGLTPVAFLSSLVFDTGEIDATTIEIDDDNIPSTEGTSPVKCFLKKDVTGDGLHDLVCHFKTQELKNDGLLVDGNNLYITGSLYDGTVIVGSDVINLAGGPYCID